MKNLFPNNDEQIAVVFSKFSENPALVFSHDLSSFTERLEALNPIAQQISTSSFFIGMIATLFIQTEEGKKVVNLSETTQDFFQGLGIKTAKKAVKGKGGWIQ